MNHDQPTPEELERQLREFEAGWTAFTGRSTFYQLPPFYDSPWLEVIRQLPDFHRKMISNRFSIGYPDPTKVPW